MYNEKLSEVKGFAIICMILGHVIQFFISDFYENRLYVIIYSFHMPLLMFISGYFFYMSTKKYSLRGIIQNKFKHLLLPILFWSFPFVLLSFFKLLNNNELILNSLLKSVRSFFGLWFLWSVLLNSIAIAIINKIFKDNFIFHVLAIILCFIIPVCAPYLFMFVCFEIGYFLARLNLKKIICDKKIQLVNFFILIPLLLFYKSNYLCDVSGMCVLKSFSYQFFIDIYRLVTAFSMSFLLISFFYDIKRKLYIFELFGKNTMGVYIISAFFLTYLLGLFFTNGYITIAEFKYLKIFLCFFVESFVCLFVTILLKKNKFFKNLLG